MTEHPILFSPPMVRALLADRKHVTRRLSKRWLKVKAGDRLWVRETFAVQGDCDGDEPPFDDGRPIYRTTDSEGCAHWWQPHYRATDPAPDLCCESPRCKCCGEGEPGPHWKPSIHMPRWASRILLECEEDARLERLQDITEEDAVREGMKPCEFMEEHGVCPAACGAAKNDFRNLWGALHTKPGERWEDNPEVVRVGRFRRICGGHRPTGAAHE